MYSKQYQVFPRYLPKDLKQHRGAFWYLKHIKNKVVVVAALVSIQYVVVVMVVVAFRAQS